MKNGSQNPLLLFILLVRILVIYHSHSVKLSEEENISFGSSTTIAYCEPSLSPGFIGLNFLLFLNDTLHRPNLDALRAVVQEAGILAYPAPLLIL